MAKLPAIALRLRTAPGGWWVRFVIFSLASRRWCGLGGRRLPGAVDGFWWRILLGRGGLWDSGLRGLLTFLLQLTECAIRAFVHAVEAGFVAGEEGEGIGIVRKRTGSQRKGRGGGGGGGGFFFRGRWGSFVVGGR